MRVFVLNLLLIFCFFTYGQNYVSPIQLPINISGNFAELRSNHFHSGIDIKTNEKCGYPVNSIADGYVSRIKVSAFGFGKAIYITHFDGKTSVYAHLDSLAYPFSAWLKAEQYRRKQFEVDLFPDYNLLKVKKGQIIAFSGNSGGSEGPHLHFEMRETATEFPQNPLKYGFAVEDRYKPYITALAIYNHSPGANNQAKVYENRNLKFDTLLVSSEFSLGIIANDMLTDGKNQNGIYSYSISFDSILSFKCVMDEFSFNESRYINAYIDYAYFMKNKVRIQRSYVPKNSFLSMYKLVSNQGIFTLYDTLEHRIDVVIKDFVGNFDSLTFFVKQQIQKTESLVNNGSLLLCQKENQINKNSIKIKIPKNALYDNLYFKLNEIVDTMNVFSNLFSIHSIYTPLHNYMQISMKTKARIPDEFKTKICAFSIDSEGKKTYEGGQLVGDWLNFKTRSFGDYFIGIDTVAPKIEAVNFTDSTDISKFKILQLKIYDLESGIKNYHVSFDENNWLLFDYDAKNQVISYVFDEHFTLGEHQLVIEIEDERGNKIEKKFILFKNELLNL